MLASSPSKQAGEEFFALVEITLASARDLPKMDLNGEADPFCVVRLGEKACHKTQVILKTRSPVWQEKCRVLIPESERAYPLTIEVWDWDKMSSNDFIGAVTLDLAPYYKLKEYSGSFPIMLQKKKKSVNRGELQLSLHVMFPEDVQLAFWKGIYDFFDVDQSGSITKVELEGMLEGIGSPMTSDDVDELFNKFDTNKDGTVCFAELYDFVSAEKHKGDPLLSKLLPKDRDIIWKAAAQADRQSIGSAVLSNWNAQLEWGGEDKGKRKAAELMVHDRQTGKLVEEKIPSYIKVAMRLMYSTGSGRFAVDSKRVKALLKKMTVSQGKKFNAPASVKDIEPFIQFHDLNRDEMLENEFSCFNDFFFRKLKPTARPIAAPNDPKVAVSPADCRLHVFATISQATQLWIKGTNFTLQSLLQDSALAEKYEGGSLVIARLAPQDYHRFHIPVNGVLGSPVPIDGTYYTVNPVAVNETVDVYSNNKRVVTTIDSPEFGLVAFVAVGATMVGSICLTTNEGQQVRKGDEHGYFAFGGSTVLLLFPPNSITFDHDLQVNSSKPIETLVKVGVSIGRATH